MVWTVAGTIALTNLFAGIRFFEDADDVLAQAGKKKRKVGPAKKDAAAV